MVILERRSQTGKVLYRSVSGGWNGSEEDKYHLHEQLELLQKDPTYLTSDATLPELNNEMAPVSASVDALVESLPGWVCLGIHTFIWGWTSLNYIFALMSLFFPYQIFIIRWMNAAYDYMLQIYDDLLYSNW